MLSGKLNNEILIEEASETTNALNEPATSWSTYDTVWGEIISAKTVERLTGLLPVAENEISIRVRYDSGITSQMRMTIDSVAYEIVSIEPRHKKEMILIGKRVSNES